MRASQASIAGLMLMTYVQNMRSRLAGLEKAMNSIHYISKVMIQTFSLRLITLH